MAAKKKVVKAKKSAAPKAAKPAKAKATVKSTRWSNKKIATVAAKRIASLKSGKKTASNPTGRKG